MGTNYYGRPVKKFQELEELETKIIQEVWWNADPDPSPELKGIIEEYFLIKEAEIKDIHIGVTSWNSRFLFNANNDFPNKFEDFKKRISELEIYDEYDNPISQDLFWSRVENLQMNPVRKNSAHTTEIDGYEFCMSDNFC